MHRLRDLDRRGRLVAGLVLVLLTLPFAVAVLRAHDVGWEPSGDNGIIALQGFDVFSSDPPLIGLPSTAGTYVDANPNHPGPIEFYALAIPMKVLGPAMGMVTWTALANLASVLVATWVVFRRGGAAVGLWGAVVTGAIAWSQGPALLVDPVSSNAGGIPMLALAVLAVGIADGDRRLLPVFALWSAYVSQQHLGVLGFGLALSVGGVVLLVHRTWLARRRRPAAAGVDGTVALDPDADERWWPWVAGAAAIGFVCWLPVLIDTFTADDPNLEKLLHFSSSANRQTVGSGVGLRQGARALGAPPLVARTNLTGSDIVAPLNVLSWMAAAAVAIALGCIVVHRWRRRPVLARVALVSLCLAVTGALIGANVPEFEIDRLNLYRWAYTVSTLAWVAIGWELGLRLGARLPRFTAPAWRSPWVGLGAVAVVTVASCTAAGPITARDQELFRTEAALNAKVLDAVEGAGPVLILPFGTMSSRSLAQVLAVDLEDHGHPSILLRSEVPNYGDRRSLTEATPDTVIVVRTGRAGVAPREKGAKVLYRKDLNADRRAGYDQLAREAASAPAVTTAVGPGLAEELGIDSFRADLAFQNMAADPAAVLYDEELVELLARGYLSSPVFDPELLGDLRDHPLQTTWEDDTIEVVQITPEQALELYPLIK